MATAASVPLLVGVLRLAHGLAHHRLKQSSKSIAAQLVLANKWAAWHAGGQRFESAWLHLKIQVWFFNASLTAIAGVFVTLSV
ncbi:hypothetical protein [Synechococcus sp. UW140]|uniref:hypothetical protein n=1 Tax=Synechococcus sp. UW140 TaxID=368503 RepID=UPI0031377FCD